MGVPAPALWVSLIFPPDDEFAAAVPRRSVKASMGLLNYHGTDKAKKPGACRWQAAIRCDPVRTTGPRKQRGLLKCSAGRQLPAAWCAPRHCQRRCTAQESPYKASSAGAPPVAKMPYTYRRRCHRHKPCVLLNTLKLGPPPSTEVWQSMLPLVRAAYLVPHCC